MRVAIEGCCHGELKGIYSRIKNNEIKSSKKVDLVLICGDFQAIRDQDDLNSLSCPDKYKKYGDFLSYYFRDYSGHSPDSERFIAPYLTIFIGGNHESSNFMAQLYFGGWVCKNIYFLGFSGIININGLTIAGISGIYKNFDYYKGYYEKLPLQNFHVKTIYHTREFEIKKVLQYCKKIDIVLSHDWPLGIYNHGDLNELLRIKPFFKQDIDNHSLGSPASETLLNRFKPKYWFSAHMHVRFEAKVEFTNASNSNSTKKSKLSNPDEIGLSSEEEKVQTKKKIRAKSNPIIIDFKEPITTSFLALDKCQGKRNCIEVLDIPSGDDHNGFMKIYHDLEWLAIVKTLHPYVSTKNLSQNPDYPTDMELKEKIKENIEILTTKFGCEKDSLAILSPNSHGSVVLLFLDECMKQTQKLCDILEIDPIFH